MEKAGRQEKPDGKKQAGSRMEKAGKRSRTGKADKKRR